MLRVMGWVGGGLACGNGGGRGGTRSSPVHRIWKARFGRMVPEKNCVCEPAGSLECRSTRPRSDLLSLGSDMNVLAVVSA
jgi:hypothetical protein